MDTDDEKDPAAAYEEWKGRELVRIKRDRWGRGGEGAGACAHQEGSGALRGTGGGGGEGEAAGIRVHQERGTDGGGAARGGRERGKPLLQVPPVYVWVSVRWWLGKQPWGGFSSFKLHAAQFPYFARDLQGREGEDREGDRGA